jgi:hypothetical protein
VGPTSCELMTARREPSIFLWQMLLRACIWIALALATTDCGSPARPGDGAGLAAAAAGETLRMSASGLRLKTEIYRSQDPGDRPG